MNEARVVRVASGQGFWGDDPDAPVRQVEGGPIDYLMLDYLAEVTMSIMRPLVDLYRTEKNMHFQGFLLNPQVKP